MSSWSTNSERALEEALSFPAFERPAHVPTQVMEAAADLDPAAVAECFAALRVYNDETRAYLDFIEDEEANEGRSLYNAAKEKLAGVFGIGREALRSVATPARRLPLSPAIHNNPSLVLVVGGWSSREEARDADMANILSLAHKALDQTWHLFDGSRPSFRHINPTGDVRMEVKWHVGSLAAGFKVNEQGNRVQQLWEDDLSLFENSFRVVVVGDLVVDKASYGTYKAHIRIHPAF